MEMESQKVEGMEEEANGDVSEGSRRRLNGVKARVRRMENREQGESVEKRKMRQRKGRERAREAV